MFESKEDDELWNNQEEWKLQSWIFYENNGVHVLRLEDGTEINMLAERRYPLTKNTLERMMDLILTVVSDDDIVFDLLRLSIHLVVYNEELAILEQTATGKGISNPLMAGSLPKNYKANLVGFAVLLIKKGSLKKIKVVELILIKFIRM
ncbi:hypothetical protein Tco_0431607 [Tanacetum coccineum]